MVRWAHCCCFFPLTQSSYYCLVPFVNLTLLPSGWIGRMVFMLCVANSANNIHRSTTTTTTFFFFLLLLVDFHVWTAGCGWHCALDNLTNKKNKEINRAHAHFVDNLGASHFVAPTYPPLGQNTNIPLTQLSTFFRRECSPIRLAPKRQNTSRLRVYLATTCSDPCHGV